MREHHSGEIGMRWPFSAMDIQANILG